MNKTHNSSAKIIHFFICLKQLNVPESPKISHPIVAYEMNSLILLFSKNKPVIIGVFFTLQYKKK